MGPGQYNSLGEYCGSHIASSVFLILLPPFLLQFEFDSKAFRMELYCDCAQHYSW